MKAYSIFEMSNKGGWWLILSFVIFFGTLIPIALSAAVLINMFGIQSFLSWAALFSMIVAFGYWIWFGINR